MRASALVAIGVVFTAIAPAHADHTGDRASVMVSDVVADGLVLGGLAGKNKILGVAGFATYLIGAPIVHASKDHWDSAGQSLALRVAAPLALGALACKVVGDRDNHSTSIMPTRFGCVLGLTIGVLAGGAAAQIIDWKLLSSGDRPASAAPRVFSIGGSF